MPYHTHTPYHAFTDLYHTIPYHSQTMHMHTQLGHCRAYTRFALNTLWHLGKYDRNSRLNSVALLVPLRSVQFSPRRMPELRQDNCDMCERIGGSSAEAETDFGKAKIAKWKPTYVLILQRPRCTSFRSAENS